MGDEENRKATVPDSAVLGELVALHRKIDGMSLSLQNGQTEIHQKVIALTSRVDVLETSRKHDGETARRAMKSASDLSEHVRISETAVKSAFENLGNGMGKRLDDAETQLAALAKETKAQTPMLETLAKMLKEQNEIAAKKEQQRKEAAERAAQAAAEKAEEDKRAAVRRKHRVTVMRIGVSALAILAPLVASYLGAMQASKDAPKPAPQIVVVHEDAGPSR